MAGVAIIIHNYVIIILRTWLASMFIVGHTYKFVTDVTRTRALVIKSIYIQALSCTFGIISSDLLYEMDSRCIILLLTVSLSCNLVQSSDDFLSQVLMNTGENGSYCS